MLERVIAPSRQAPLAIAYEPMPTAAPGDDVLAQFAFGEDLPHDDPRGVRVGLARVGGLRGIETWRVAGPVRTGRDGFVRYAADATLSFGAIELDEREHGGTEATARIAYEAIVQHIARSSHPHLLRIWNYFDAINVGEDDAERYRRFCVGRAQGLAPVLQHYYPAATAIGRRDGDTRLQVYWLASATPGVPLENPRQVSAYRYPRRYGPVSPSFSRAMLAGNEALLISGTSSVVGHETHHAGDIDAQLDETLTNLDHVLAHAHRQSPAVPARFGAHSALKVYLRDASAAPAIEARLRERLGTDVPFMLLAGDICRADLAVEIDGAHRA
jgi:chorismate lyase / 3-hydroxybenzoate synthase